MEAVGRDRRSGLIRRAQTSSECSPRVKSESTRRQRKRLNDWPLHHQCGTKVTLSRYNPAQASKLASAKVEAPTLETGGSYKNP